MILEMDGSTLHKIPASRAWTYKGICRLSEAHVFEHHAGFRVLSEITEENGVMIYALSFTLMGQIIGDAQMEWLKKEFDIMDFKESFYGDGHVRFFSKPIAEN